METPIPVLESPFELFRQWMADAVALGIKYPNALALATVDAEGMPDVRMVLLKGLSEHGFVFYTNFNSTKGRQILASKRAGMCFFWEPIQRQIRIRGRVEIVTEGEADEYFQTRPRISQLGAWASQQSSEIAGRAVLEARVAELTAKYEGQPVPRPTYWSGFRVIPTEIEFWKEGDFRLHDRLRYRRAEGGGWKTSWLSP